MSKDPKMNMTILSNPASSPRTITEFVDYMNKRFERIVITKQLREEIGYCIDEFCKNLFNKRIAEKEFIDDMNKWMKEAYYIKYSRRE